MISVTPNARSPITATVVLGGDTGVGKTGLSLVLNNLPFEATDSTPGRRVWTFDSREVKVGSNFTQTRETLLWDLATPVSFYVPGWVARGLVEPLDIERIPNLQGALHEIPAGRPPDHPRTEQTGARGLYSLPIAAKYRLHFGILLVYLTYNLPRPVVVISAAPLIQET